MHVTKAELDELSREHLDKAAASPRGRSAHAVLKDGRLRHTLMALTTGGVLDDHAKPESATLLVLQGSVKVSWDGGEQRVDHGGLFVLPDAVHNVAAEAPAVFLLSTIA